MSEPNRYIKAISDWFMQFKSTCTGIKSKYGQELDKLVKKTGSRLVFKEHKDRFSDGLGMISKNISSTLATWKAFSVTRVAVILKTVGRFSEVLKPGLRKHRNALIPGVAAITLIAVVFAVTYKPIYAVAVDGEVIGYVHEVELLQESFGEVIESLELELEQEVAPNETIEFVRVRGERVEVAEVDEIKDALLNCVSFKTPGYMMVINGEEVLGVSSKEEAESILDSIKADYKVRFARKNSVIEEIEIEEEVIIEEMDIPLGCFMDPEDAIVYLMSGGIETEIYKVAKGDSLWSITKDFSIPLDDLRAANPNLNGDTLSVGQELNMKVTHPYLNIISREKVTETVKIAFSEEVKRDSSMWTTERRVAQRGQSGQKAVVYEVVRRNGVVIDKEKHSESVIQEPVTQIVVRGSRQDSAATVIGTGRFFWPVQGRITSPYGSRSGGFHTGVDIAAAKNTPIRAADDGTVTVAVYSNRGYGNRIEIYHGNGYSTLYAHCNSLAVRQGQVVKKGQVIAYVGSTGRSSGDHLHFEIRVNGRHVNPMKYF